MSQTPSVSVCIPARNEERFIRPCLESVRAAERELGEPVEIVVVLNRCTDRTEEIAREFGAKIVREDAKNLSIIRNAGVRAASGEIVATIDADSRMTPNMLATIKRQLATGKVVGGGVAIRPERLSLGIVLTGALILLATLPMGISGGLFWFYKKDFEAMGGFDETLLTGEDVHFALRLKRHGRQSGRRFKNLLRAYIVSSCRKFDQFGDWYLFKPSLLWKLWLGRDRHEADRLWYDVQR